MNWSRLKFKINETEAWPQLSTVDIPPHIAPTARELVELMEGETEVGRMQRMQRIVGNADDNTHVTSAQQKGSAA